MIRQWKDNLQVGGGKIHLTFIYNNKSLVSEQNFISLQTSGAITSLRFESLKCKCVDSVSDLRLNDAALDNVIGSVARRDKQSVS